MAKPEQRFVGIQEQVDSLTVTVLEEKLEKKKITEFAEEERLGILRELLDLEKKFSEEFDTARTQELKDYVITVTQVKLYNLIISVKADLAYAKKDFKSITAEDELIAEYNKNDLLPEYLEAVGDYVM